MPPVTPSAFVSPSDTNPPVTESALSPLVGDGMFDRVLERGCRYYIIRSGLSAQGVTTISPVQVPPAVTSTISPSTVTTPFTAAPSTVREAR